ncbi:MAG TPA: hypothetical protein VFQ44_30515 [Streptosporangiaceae bacterium]|nr:hypothetical protein [Streptosporangiaceae bacterium]
MSGTSLPWSIQPLTSFGPQHARVVLKPPECARAAAAGPKLKTVCAARIHRGTGKPFGIAISSDGKAVFVVTDAAVQVYEASGGTLTYSGRNYPVGSASRRATAATVTRDGRYLLVAMNSPDPNRLDFAGSGPRMALRRVARKLRPS